MEKECEEEEECVVTDKEETNLITVESSTSKDRNRSIDSFFRAPASTNLPNVSKPTFEKKRKQQDEHFCTYRNCHKTISRGNKSSKIRHGLNAHKSDPNFKIDFLLPINHKKVVEILKKKKADQFKVLTQACDSTDGESLDVTESNTCSFEDESMINVDECENVEEEKLTSGAESDLNVKKRVQSVVSFQKADEVTIIQQAENKNDMKEMHEKLDFLIQKLSLNPNPNDSTTTAPSEAKSAVEILNAAENILEISGSGISFFTSDSEAMVRCDDCFAIYAANDPSLFKKDPFYLYHSSANAGKRLALGLIISNTAKKQLIDGHNQPWYRMKKRLLDHISCLNKDNEGDKHYNAIIERRKRNQREKVVTKVVCNQLKCALTAIKTKSANLHYEHLIDLLHSTGSDVGNIGHGRNQMRDMIKAFQAFIHIKVNKLLSTPLPSTGIMPHFCTTSDKSTPQRVTNHAVMVILRVNGEKQGIPISAPPVYEFSNSKVIGGTANHLAQQVLSSLKSEVKIPEEFLSYLTAHQADGQYQAKDFVSTLKSVVGGDDPPLHHNTFFVVPWDTGHWMDCAMGDVREKDRRGEVLRRLVLRCNKFNTMYGHGRGYAEYKGYAEEHSLSATSTANYSTTRFTSSAFNTFLKVYNDYEALAGAFTQIRETDEEEEEMKYLIKGRDFIIDLCGVIDVLSPLMDIMIRCQAVHQFIWSITKLWPRAKLRLEKAVESLRDQSLSNDPKFSKDILPKLNEHVGTLMDECPSNCSFKSIELLPGWMIYDQSDVVSDEGNTVQDENTETAEHLSIKKKNNKSKKQKKKYQWIDRCPSECFSELIDFCSSLINTMDNRYLESVTTAAHTLGKCLFIPDILAIIQGKSSLLSAQNQLQLHNYGKSEFKLFFEYVCTLPHIKYIAEIDESVMFIPELSEMIHYKFKELVIQIVWNNLGDCRSIWFPSMDPENYKHSDNSDLIEFKVIKRPTELDDVYVFVYSNHVCKTIFDENAAISTIYRNELVYGKLGREMCIIIDVADSKSGSEAVVESFYSVMKAQSMPGGQHNDTLVGRTCIDWCFPHAPRCHETMKEIAKLYLEGNREFGLKSHRPPIFIDSRGRARDKWGSSSKVLNRLAKDTNSFILCDLDKN